MSVYLIIYTQNPAVIKKQTVSVATVTKLVNLTVWPGYDDGYGVSQYGTRHLQDI